MKFISSLERSENMNSTATKNTCCLGRRAAKKGLWEPRHGRRSKGRPVKSYINILAADTGTERSELPGLMGNREQWKTIVDSARARSTE